MRCEAAAKLRASFPGESGRPSKYCNYGLNPAYEALFRDSALRVAAQDEAGAVRAVELSRHPFFVATLFQPERAALRGAEHPLVTAFVQAAASHGSTDGGSKGHS